MTQPRDPTGSDDPGYLNQRRLWTPWRMPYVGGSTSEPGCVFCNRLAATNDVPSLILFRGTAAFVIMNLFPYNTGHAMIVPNEHTPSPEVASAAGLDEMSRLRPPLLRALRRTLSCHGFNLGLNVGAEAGAGIAGHLHEHVVPRWIGDANFMPILAGTTVMPELIPVTYAKVRAELVRELTGSAEIHCVVLTQDGVRVLTDEKGAVPSLIVTDDRPLWRAAATMIGSLIEAQPRTTAWAGLDDGAIGMSFEIAANVAEPTPATGWRWLATADALRGPTGAFVASATANRPN